MACLLCGASLAEQLALTRAPGVPFAPVSLGMQVTQLLWNRRFGKEAVLV
jgi:hypothetical protein